MFTNLTRRFYLFLFFSCLGQFEVRPNIWQNHNVKGPNLLSLLYYILHENWIKSLQNAIYLKFDIFRVYGMQLLLFMKVGHLWWIGRCDRPVGWQRCTCNYAIDGIYACKYKASNRRVYTTVCFYAWTTQADRRFSVCWIN